MIKLEMGHFTKSWTLTKFFSNFFWAERNVQIATWGKYWVLNLNPASEIT